MVRQLRRGQGQNGLILANGGILTYQHAICLSSRPPSNGIMYPNVQNAHQVAIEVPISRVTHVAEGDAVIEVSRSINYSMQYPGTNQRNLTPDVHG